jgi:hypothetical protein
VTAIAFRPPAPQPRTKPLGLLARSATLRRNPIEIWTKAHCGERSRGSAPHFSLQCRKLSQRRKKQGIPS